MTTNITLSIEIELAWGHHDLVGGIHDALSPNRTAETRALERLLSLCDSCNIPITFSVVGHLLEESCTGSHDGPHAAGWFAVDPGTDVATDPHFYAPDLVNRIQDADVDHEIATHTYSHVLCNEVSSQTLQWEFNRSKDRFNDAGIEPPRSFVAPRHRSAPPEILIQNGIHTLRRPLASYSQPSGKIGTFYSALFDSHPSSLLTHSNNQVKTYCTPYPSLTTPTLPTGQSSPHPIFQIIPRQIRQFLHRRFLCEAIKKAIKDDEHLHLWTHLHNFSNNPQWEVIETILSKLGQKQRQKEVSIQTMKSLSENV